MITLHTFGPAFGLPDPSPFVMKAEMLLKLANLPYRKEPTGLRKAPKGKLPYIDDDDQSVADSTFIRWHIEKKYGFDFDQGLSAQERGVAWAVEKLMEDNLYWISVRWRWLDDANFARGPTVFFRGIPRPVRGLVERMVRRKVKQNLHAHGIGRHSDAEQMAIAARTLAALSDILGDKPYLMGAQPCGTDATLFAFAAGVLCPHFDTPLRKEAERHANLVRYVQNMQARYFAEDERVAA